MAFLGKRSRLKRISASADEAPYAIEVGDGYARVVPARETSLSTYVPLASLDLPPVTYDLAVEQPV